MGSMQAEGFAECTEMGICTKEQGLRAHLSGNFYPVLPLFVQEDIVKVFKEHWAGKIKPDKMYGRCHLRNIEAFYKYFYYFLNAEERDGD